MPIHHSFVIYLLIHVLQDTIEDLYKSQSLDELPKQAEEPGMPLTNDEAGDSGDGVEEKTEAAPSPCSPAGPTPKVSGIPSFNLDFMANAETDQAAAS